MLSEPTDEERVLTRSDVWILATLITRGGRVTLPTLIHEADYLNRMVLTFDEVSLGLPRLIATRYAVVGQTVEGQMYFEATAKAKTLHGSDRGPINFMLALMGSMARPYPEPEIDDRSAGRLPGLSEAEFDSGVRAAGY